jgi:glycosyltransferase involved in cell wall biosynthesis
MFSQVPTQRAAQSRASQRPAAVGSPIVGSVAIIKSRGVPLGLAPRGLDGGTLSLVKSVPALVAAGIRVAIFTSDTELDAPRIERIGRVEVHRLPGFSSQGLEADTLDLERARSFEAGLVNYAPFAAETFDVLHTHHWTSALPNLLARHQSARHVHTPHLLVTEKAAMLGKVPSWEALAIERNGFVMADRIIAVSAAEANTIGGAYGVSTAKLRVIPNGVSAEFQTAASSSETIAARIVARPLRIVSVGRLVPQKGFDVLIRAIAMAQASGLDVQCDIVGAPYHSEPFYPAALAQLVEELGLTAKVRFLGEQDSAGVAKCLARAAVYVQPTRYESQGVAILEAMAMGLPIVATQLAAIAEYVETGRNGVLVEPENAEAAAKAIVQLSAAPERAAAMSAANRASAKTFDWNDSNRLLLESLGFGDEAGA